MTRMTKNALALCLAALSLCGEHLPNPDQPRYTNDGQLILPENYREWIYLTSGLGMTYGLVEAANLVTGKRFDNVFVSPAAYRTFLETGSWPDKTVLIKEVRTSSSKGSINKGGAFQEELVELEAHVKDRTRFTTPWEFFVFTTATIAKPLGARSNCQVCHNAAGAVDSTFVQFYPTLKARGAK